MAVMCTEIQDWIETEVERPIQTWETQKVQQCRNEQCQWWTLCLNVVFCWFEVAVVMVVRFVWVTIGKWVVRAICEVTTFLLDVGAFIVNLVLSIPVIGGILRTVMNWISELVWRLVGLVDLLLFAVGVRPEKRIYVGLVIPRIGGVPVTTEAAMMRQIDAARTVYKSLCNVKIVYSGACEFPIDAPTGLTIDCDAGGFFADWWTNGSYIEFASAFCKFSEGWRRVVGWGAEIIIVPVPNVTPDGEASSTQGCSFSATHNYVVVEPGATVTMAAHEIGHACMLPHDGNAANLMFPNVPVSPTLTATQAAIVRGSRHCVYI